jgi:methyltransferase (TIGR00027 family)
MPIQHISDTALLTAYARATESERPDALFRDEYARALAGDRGAELARETEAFATIANSVACRTRVFDDLLLRLVREEGLDLVLNLGAGLDTRPWRLDLPPSLKWVDVDLPEILAYKRERVGERSACCGYEGRPADLSVRTELSEVIGSAAHARKALILSEGILVYLTEQDVAALAAELHAQSTIGWWLTDIAGPKALPMMAKAWGELLAGAQYQFAPTSPVAFFRARGWQEVEFRSAQAEAQRLGRAHGRGLIGSLLWSIFPVKIKTEIHRLAGVAILHRVDA